jgi:hypothetical protein
MPHIGQKRGNISSSVVLYIALGIAVIPDFENCIGDMIPLALGFVNVTRVTILILSSRRAKFLTPFAAPQTRGSLGCALLRAAVKSGGGELA